MHERWPGKDHANLFGTSLDANALRLELNTQSGPERVHSEKRQRSLGAGDDTSFRAFGGDVLDNGAGDVDGEGVEVEGLEQVLESKIVQ